MHTTKPRQKGSLFRQKGDQTRRTAERIRVAARVKQRQHQQQVAEDEEMNGEKGGTHTAIPYCLIGGSFEKKAEKI